jgi:DNA-binding MarR family transcriptional regulator
MESGAALTTEEFAAWKPIAAALELLPTTINSALQRCTGHSLVSLYVLGHLRRQGNRTAGVSDLAACTNTALPRMSRTLAKLESDGLVRRGTCMTDGRAVIITLTDKGDEALAAAMPHHDRIVRELIIDVLSPEQLFALSSASSALADHLHPDIDAPVDRQRARAMA